MSASAESTARELVERALSVASEATSVERALIDALRSRYSPSPPTGSRLGRDSAYVRAMAEVYERFPEHSEVAMLYADALMLLEPRRGAWPIEKPSVRLIHEVLESVLARDLGHPGACHAYLHATETTSKVVEAQRCADLLGSSIPGASHINHMPSHTYNRVGRWGDATRANIEAWHTDLRAERGAGFAIYPSHNLHMLFFSAAMDGQGAISIQAAKDYEKLDPSDGASFRSLALVRFGRFDEVLELTRSPTHPIHAGLWAFGRGLAHLRMEQPDSARWYLARVDSLAEHAPEGSRFRVHSAALLLGIVGGILRGEILRSDDRVDEAIQALHDAIAIEGALTYDEPEPLPFAVRDYLGAVLLEVGRAEEATPVYEAALAARPHNGWSLLGLERSLRMQGRIAEANEVKERFERAWVRSEVWLPASRF
jgi:tetratricopeptide (TPR) repeat protein